MARYGRRGRSSYYGDGGYAGYGGGGYGGFAPYVPVHERRARATREMEKRRKAGQTVSPIVVEGREIATTFWGKSWCQNLERYSDYSNRLPRGRTYVRNGSVVHLEIGSGKVEAHVSGSMLYEVTVKVSAVPAPRWKALCTDCAGSIDSLVELLQGKFHQGVMERICRQGSGLFPSPAEIDLDCSCPDYADMCKHVAAVLYGVGARLDADPALLFRLRKVSEQDLIAGAAAGLPLAKRAPRSKKVLADADVAAVFGVEMASTEADPKVSPKAPKPRKVSPKTPNGPAARKGAATAKPIAKAKPAVKAKPIAKAQPVVKAKPVAKGKPVAKAGPYVPAKPSAKRRSAATRKPSARRAP